jgi:hypothetical protein
LVLAATLVTLAVAGYYIVSVRASSSVKIKEAETLVTDVLVAQYTRPISVDAKHKIVATYDPSIDEVQRETTRILTELDHDQKTMEERSAEYRDSKVRVRFRSVEADGDHITLVAEVLADWYWGYHNNPTDTPTQVYGLHEFRLNSDDKKWRVVLHRNLASSPKTQVQVPPLGWND